jgi:hypothetical protein
VAKEGFKKRRKNLGDRISHWVNRIYRKLRSMKDIFIKRRHTVPVNVHSGPMSCECTLAIIGPEDKCMLL